MRHCAVHTELMLDKKGEIKIIETASRLGGYRDLMYREAYGFNLNQLLVKSVIGKEIKTRKRPLAYVSMMEIFPRQEGKYSDILGLDLLEKDPEVGNIEILPKKGEKVGPAKLGYWPCLRFTIKGKTYKEAYQKSIDYQKQLVVDLAS
ncbi:hypothetical protein IPJ72_04705 [Candidatus Peregrinibacteria bacterium]|nr:MAG: hypothetical protein IPJ72_04705 [Candidatus Peregrinibacteria bacterium]